MKRGLVSVVGIPTGYGLDCPGIKSRWGARFSAPVQTGPGAHPASCTMGTGSFSGVKQPGRGTHPPSSADVKEIVELCLYFPPGPSWPVLGIPLPLPLLTKVVSCCEGSITTAASLLQSGANESEKMAVILARLFLGAFTKLRKSTVS